MKASQFENILLAITLALALNFNCNASVQGFVEHSRRTHHRRQVILNAENHFDLEISKGLERARALLKKSKAKLASKASGAAEAPKIPFFATSGKNIVARDVVKSVDAKTGLITADGEKMAAISEAEDWEFRSLSEVFQSEINENGDVYSRTNRQLADRDVAASIWNLRKELKTEDYLRIFDKKNYFIGEDT
jgi:hypothetical protein